MINIGLWYEGLYLLIRLYLKNAAFVYIAWRYVPGSYQVPQPLRGIGVYLVVVRASGMGRVMANTSVKRSAHGGHACAFVQQ
jgi:hypothetical protein